MSYGPYRLLISCLLGALIQLVSPSVACASKRPGVTDTIQDQPYWVEQVVSGLKFPGSIIWLPDGDALILERLDGLRVLHKGRLEDESIGGLPPSFRNIYNGYKDIVIDPDYLTNHTLYVLLTEGTYERHHAAVYRASYSPEGLSNVTLIFREKDDVGGPAPKTGRMIFLPDKTLLIGVSEDDLHKMMAQELTSHIGKLVRIRRDGSIPPDNPFLKTPAALPEIWSYGHRVPTGLYCDVQDGSLWEVEPGPRGGDEFNRLKAGVNFGWAKASWGFDYSGGMAAPMQFGPGIEQPLLVWMPTAPPASLTPAGLTRYRGRAYPNWNGDFFVGFLAGKAVERLRLQADQVVLREKMLTDLDERIRDIKVGPDDRLYLLTDHQNGRVLRLQPGRPRRDELPRVAHKLQQNWQTQSSSDLALIAPGDPVKGKQAFAELCSGCHSVGTMVQGGALGPNLAGIVDRRMGSRVEFGYSPAMAGSPQVWNVIALNLFLANPAGYVPGTTMSAPPVIDAETRSAIVGFLQQQSPKEGQAGPY